MQIRILGNITAGYPIEAIETGQETITVPSIGLSRNENYYALRVKGESMIEDGIFDGDIVVIKRQSVAENGQTVVAIIDDNEATLKKIYREKDKFRLQPANQAATEALAASPSLNRHTHYYQSATHPHTPARSQAPAWDRTAPPAPPV